MFPLQIPAWVPLSGASLLGERIREHLPGATSGIKVGEELASCALTRAGRTWLCFPCVLSTWFCMHGKAYCSPVKGFMGGSGSVP